LIKSAIKEIGMDRLLGLAKEYKLLGMKEMDSFISSPLGVQRQKSS
jgi:hypothetical protein